MTEQNHTRAHPGGRRSQPDSRETCENSARCEAVSRLKAEVFGASNLDLRTSAFGPRPSRPSRQSQQFHIQHLSFNIPNASRPSRLSLKHGSCYFSNSLIAGEAR